LELDLGSNNEHPSHPVVIPKPFAVSKFELTFDEWDTCVAYGGCERGSDHNWGRGQRPVIYVTWSHAQQYVTWLSKMTGKPYRLLSEAEYEYATRARKQTVYPWGDKIKFDGVAMTNCIGCGSEWDKQKTAPINSFPLNEFGLGDMVGNVFEWVEDCYHSGYEIQTPQGKISAPTDGTVWPGGDCSFHVVRAGSWDAVADNVRSAFRAPGVTDTRDGNLGFRVARSLLAP
jgi:formylglycine-generating enzyme required for sulfatase activity